MEVLCLLIQSNLNCRLIRGEIDSSSKTLLGTLFFSSRKIKFWVGLSNSRNNFSTGLMLSTRFITLLSTAQSTISIAFKINEKQLL